MDDNQNHINHIELLKTRIDQLKARVADLEGVNRRLVLANSSLVVKNGDQQSALKEAKVALEWMLKFGREHGSKCVCLRCEKTNDSLATINKALEEK